MPRPILPPTPQSSVDLPPKPPPSLSSLELAFTLPPPALGSTAAASSTSAPPHPPHLLQLPPPPPPPPPALLKPSYDVSSSPAPSSYIPLSPTSPLDVAKAPSNAAAPQQSKKRRRASTLENPKSQPSPKQKQKPTAPTEAIILPPPPTRNRKIIQMKPRQPSTSSASSGTQPSSSSSSSSSSSVPEPKAKSKRASLKSDKLAEDGKPTTAVGRKIARKTAHSLIERRRRFKMNEEFGVLKGMIPACTGVEMHKLAILQASIEYLKYLEQCVVDLKASNSAATHLNQVPTFPPEGYDNDDDEEDEDEEDDEEMADPEPISREQHEEHQEPTDDSTNTEETSARNIQTEEPTPTYPTYYAAPEPASPYLHSTKPQHSPTEPHYSPAYFPPQPMSTTASPNLYPQHLSSESGHDQVDTEVTHALLLLADGSRRSSEATRGNTPEKKGRGMSVKDLLSS